MRSFYSILSPFIRYGSRFSYYNRKFVVISIFGFQYFQKDEEISSFSSNLKNRAVLKYDDNDHRLDIYHHTYLCFARKSDTVSTEIKGYHGKWLTNDCEKCFDFVQLN